MINNQFDADRVNAVCISLSTLLRWTEKIRQAEQRPDLYRSVLRKLSDEIADIHNERLGDLSIPKLSDVNYGNCQEKDVPAKD